jgi:hypothetical protein
MVDKKPSEKEEGPFSTIKKAMNNRYQSTELD